MFKLISSNMIRLEHIMCSAPCPLYILYKILQLNAMLFIEVAVLWIRSSAVGVLGYFTFTVQVRSLSSSSSAQPLLYYTV
jgi:hypothetical protein